MNVDSCICFYPDEGKTELSEDFPARKGKLRVSLRKQKYLMNKEGKNAPVCFFHQVGDCKYSWFFVWWKCCFLFRHRVLGSEKPFPTGVEMCKDTPRLYWTIHSLRKHSGRSILWVLLPYLLLPWVGEITLSDDFVALISQCLGFEKTHILQQNCDPKEEKNEPFCISFRLKMATILQSHKDMLPLPLGCKSQANRNKCPCS